MYIHVCMHISARVSDADIGVAVESTVFHCGSLPVVCVMMHLCLEW